VSISAQRLRSFVQEANHPDCDFPLENLPYCIFHPGTTQGNPRVGVAIGNKVLDLKVAVQRGVFEGLDAEVLKACGEETLNSLFALENGIQLVRQRLVQVLAEGSSNQSMLEDVLVDQVGVVYHVPFAIGDYTDFFASVNHATNVGKMYRPETPLLPNFKTQPLAYHGRASTVVVSGESVQRPWGNYRIGHAGELTFAPTEKLDFEVEIGVYIGRGNHRYNRIPIDDAEQHVAGICLVNDWSARDIQAWETQPLGPFLGKNFATTVSPWVVTLAALSPFRRPAASQADTEPSLSPYLRSEANRVQGGLEIHIETCLRTARMREEGGDAEKISTSRFDRDSYWSVSQMIAHHTVNGCSLRGGDLLASGTLSGPTEGSEGCLLELTRGGSDPLRLRNGEIRRYLEDGDEVLITAFCRNEQGLRIGFGTCRALVTPAHSPDENNQSWTQNS
jgi:fumarylacetoacetase